MELIQSFHVPIGLVIFLTKNAYFGTSNSCSVLEKLADFVVKCMSKERFMLSKIKIFGASQNGIRLTLRILTLSCLSISSWIIGKLSK